MQENNFKKKVREAYLSCLMEELAHARRGHAEAKRDTIAAEGRMVTRYDSTKTEVGWLADGFLKDVRELLWSIFFVTLVAKKISLHYYELTRASYGVA